LTRLTCWRIDSSFLGEMDLAGCSAKMVIDKDQAFGIHIKPSEADVEGTAFNAASFADQKHWYAVIVHDVKLT
jgi:hypothetical protein